MKFYVKKTTQVHRKENFQDNSIVNLHLPPFCLKLYCSNISDIQKYRTINNQFFIGQQSTFIIIYTEHRYV